MKWLRSQIGGNMASYRTYDYDHLTRGHRLLSVLLLVLIFLLFLEFAMECKAQVLKELQQFIKWNENNFKYMFGPFLSPIWEWLQESLYKLLLRAS